MGIRAYNIDSVKAITRKREPDFENLLQVLRQEVPTRPTLYEFFLNGPLEEALVDDPERWIALGAEQECNGLLVPAFRAAVTEGHAAGIMCSYNVRSHTLSPSPPCRCVCLPPGVFVLSRLSMVNC